MTHHSITSSADLYRRFGTARRVFTLASIVPSQDVTRYQAHNMPKPKFDLARENEPTPRLTIVLRVLSRMAAGAVIGSLRRFTTLFHS
jgi:hypothetical protein